MFRFLLLVLVLPIAAFAQGLHPIGSQRQFFFDEALVERLTNTRLRLNTASKVDPNPIIKRDRPWEFSDMTISWVFYDQLLQKYRMRYTTGAMLAVGRNEKGEVIVQGEEPQGRIHCEAYSDDGIHWEKPNLGLVTFAGSTDNNILPEEYTQVEYCFQDLHEVDPQKRYKGFVRKGDVHSPGMTVDLYTSPDSFHWTAYAGNPVVDNGSHVGRWGPTFFQGWDPIRETYFAHLENNFHMNYNINTPYRRRSIGRIETRDLISWGEPETIVVTDELDYPDTEFYALPTNYYEGWQMGIAWIFSTTNTNYTSQFVFSRDGVHYDRRFRESLINRGDTGDFDSVVILPQAPIMTADKVLIYYDGSNWRSPEDLMILGEKAVGFIGLAVLPLDGFVSLEGARSEDSIVLTKSLTFTGSELVLNLHAATQQWGAEPCDVRIELLDGRHAVIAGFSYDDADIISTTDTHHLVTWGGRSDLSSLAGKAVRVKIYFRNAKLYSFQFR